MKQPLSLKARALRLIAQREYSRVELKRKLSRCGSTPHPGSTPQPGSGDRARASDHEAADDRPDTGADEQALEALLDWLESKDLLSNERFVEARIHARAGKFGNQRIVRELQQHGVELSGDTAAGLRASERERARAVWRKKFGAPPASAQERAKQMRFLAARGFSAEVVRQVIEADDEPDAP